jgi:hypothetical protein
MNFGKELFPGCLFTVKALLASVSNAGKVIAEDLPSGVPISEATDVKKIPFRYFSNCLFIRLNFTQ